MKGAVGLTVATGARVVAGTVDVCGAASIAVEYMARPPGQDARSEDQGPVSAPYPAAAWQDTH